MSSGHSTRQRQIWKNAIRSGEIIICGICNKRILSKISVDHIIPIALGGHDTIQNMQPAHADCNHAKADNLTIDKDDLDRRLKVIAIKRTNRRRKNRLKQSKEV